MKPNLRTCLLICAVWMVALTGACSIFAPGGETQTPTADTPTSPPVLATATPRGGAVGGAVGGAIPPLAQVTPVTAPGSDWVALDALGVRLAVPPGWKTISPDAVGGPDGYARLSSPALDGAAPSAACIIAANRDKPDAFGANPEIRDLNREGAFSGCLILPSFDQPAARQGDSLLLAWLPDGQQPAIRLALHADRGHIEALAASLQLSQASPGVTYQCDTTIQGQPAQVVTTGGLRISEFPVAEASTGAVCDPQSDPLAFNAVATSGEAAARTSEILDTQFSAARVARLNQALAPFGISIRTVERRFAIDQQGTKLHSNISWIGPLSLNASGTDFRLPMIDGYDNGTFVLSPAGLQRDEGWDILLFDRVFPVFVNDDLVSAAYDYDRYPRQVNDPALLNISKNGQVISTWSLDGATSDGGPVRSLAGWDGHWLLELPGVLVEDGEMLNEQLGYPEMFTWRLVNRQPLYFFRTGANQDGLVHISYAGETLADVAYADVIHTALGGNAVLLRLKAYESGLFFYARRGGVWYYVTIQPVSS